MTAIANRGEMVRLGTELAAGLAATQRSTPSWVVSTNAVVLGATVAATRC